MIMENRFDDRKRRNYMNSKSEDNKFPEYEYTPPTREALVRAMHSDGSYVGICRFCKQKIRATSEQELKSHKCDGQTN